VSETRNHHYVPQGYLRAFASGVGGKAQFWVADNVKRKAFVASVRNVAAKRDFNRIETDGGDPNALESGLAKFEAEAVSALRRTIEAVAFVSDDDRLAILNLVGLMAIRNPRFRRRMGDFVVHTSRIIAEMMVSSKSPIQNGLTNFNLLQGGGSHVGYGRSAPRPQRSRWISPNPSPDDGSDRAMRRCAPRPICAAAARSPLRCRIA
jgi:hypothetical protein